MNRIAGIVMGGVLVARLAGAGEAGSAASSLSVDADLPVVSAYVWRGQVINDEAVFQPALNMAKGNFGVNVWGNLDLTGHDPEAGEFSEVDLTLSYGNTIGAVQYGVGMVEYLFPHQTLVEDGVATATPGTREVYLSLSLPDLRVVPGISLYRDIDEVDGTYISASLGYNQSLGDALTLDVGGSLGMADANYNAYYFGVDREALNDANVGVALTFEIIKDTLTISPSVQYTWLPDGDIKDGASGLYRGRDAVVGMLNVNYVF